jgi:hypothetical protein
MHANFHTLFDQNGQVSATQSLWIKRAVAAAGSIDVFSASPGMCDTAMLLFDFIAKKPESTVPAEVCHLLCPTNVTCFWNDTNTVESLKAFGFSACRLRVCSVAPRL